MTFFIIMAIVNVAFIVWEINDENRAVRALIERKEE